jgi:hypothetical protein
MNDNLRRRRAAFLLRQRAADALDEASRLDGLPAMRLLDEHVDAIATALGISAEELTAAVMRIWPGNDQ